MFTGVQRCMTYMSAIVQRLAKTRDFVSARTGHMLKDTEGTKENHKLLTIKTCRTKKTDNCIDQGEMLTNGLQVS